jgi:hypothetical protein
MDDLIRNLEKNINDLEVLSKNLNQIRNPLLENSLEYFRFMFVEDKNGVALYKQLEPKELKETLFTLKTDLLPLFEEFDSQEGLEQLKEWIKLLEEHVRE